MMHHFWSHNFFAVFIAFISLSLAAEMIDLERTVVYRKQEYRSFDTRKTNVSALVAILKVLEEENAEQENQAVLRKALEDGDFKHHSAYAYIYPPILLDEFYYYEIPLYGKQKKWLRLVLRTLQDLNNTIYQAAIRRIRARIDAISDEVDKESTRGRKKVPAKAKRMREDPQTDRNQELEPPQKKGRDEDEPHDTIDLIPIEALMENGDEEIRVWLETNMPFCLQ